MILYLRVEVTAAAGEQPLCVRDFNVEADPDILFVPGVAQAAQSVVGKTLREAEKEMMRREARKLQQQQEQ